MALALYHKSSIRRHLGYPVAGLATQSPAGGSLMSTSVGYRFFQAYGQLEWRMDALSPDEESRLIGLAYGTVALVGTPASGDQVSVTFSGINGQPLANPVTITVTAGPTDTLLTLTAAIAALATQNSTLGNAGFFAVAPYGTGPFSQIVVPNPEVNFTNPVPFNLSATADGLIGAQLQTTPKILSPQALIPPTGPNAMLYSGYLAILDALEGAVPTASANLDTLKADVWTARHDEVRQREELYKNWRVRLSRFLGIPLADELGEFQAIYRSGSRAII